MNPGSFGDLSDRARVVLSLARLKAQRLNRRSLDTGLFLFAVLEEGNSVAARILAESGYDLADLDSRLVALYSETFSEPEMDEIHSPLFSGKKLSLPMLCVWLDATSHARKRQKQISVDDLVLSAVRTTWMAASVLVAQPADILARLMESIEHGLEPSVERIDFGRIQSDA